ncbi:hypothetical protein MBLNU459_g3817t1 [Dothideomycetes sp. NU459]
MSSEKRHDLFDVAGAAPINFSTHTAPQAKSLERQRDNALEFLRHHGVQGNFCHDKARMRRLTRKIDCIIIPFLLLAYLMNYLDKVLLNYSNVMGLTADLQLEGNDFSNAGTTFWIAVLVAEFPNAYLLQRLPTPKWLGLCLIGWGVASACTAATHNYRSLIVTRVFCGLFESCVVPALMLISGQWYTRQEQISRFVWWYMGTAGGFTIGGLMSWAFQHISKHAPLASWRVMYIVLGCVTIVIAIAILFLVPHTPMDAWFMSDEEKVSLLEHIKTNQTGVMNRNFRPGQIKEALGDVQLWLMWLLIVCEGIGGGVITTYSASLIKGMGNSPERSALLNMGTGPVTMSGCILGAICVRYLGKRWLIIVLLTSGAVIGAGLLSWAPKQNRSAQLAGIYLVNLSVSVTPVLYAWMSCNVAGHTKRSFAMAILNAAFALGNIIGPQTFQAKDAPAYKPAKRAMFAIQLVVGAVAAALFVYYKIVNKKRLASYESDGDQVADEKAYSGLTDKKNPDFHYLY